VLANMLDLANTYIGQYRLGILQLDGSDAGVDQDLPIHFHLGGPRDLKSFFWFPQKNRICRV
jgi:hypothetical protein